MCFNLDSPNGITFSYAGLVGVVMLGRYAGLTLPNQKVCLSDRCNGPQFTSIVIEFDYKCNDMNWTRTMAYDNGS